MTEYPYRIVRYMGIDFPITMKPEWVVELEHGHTLFVRQQDDALDAPWIGMLIHRNNIGGINGEWRTRQEAIDSARSYLASFPHDYMCCCDVRDSEETTDLLIEAQPRGSRFWMDAVTTTTGVPVSEDNQP